MMFVFASIDADCDFTKQQTMQLMKYKNDRDLEESCNTIRGYLHAVVLLQC
jgi:hypothetical protein